MTLPLALIPWIEQRFLLDDGSPNADGTVETYEAGTTTPLETYTGSDPALDPANPTTITLDSDGRPPDPIFLLPQGYKFVVKDADGATLYTIDDIEDPGSVAFATLGNVQAQGSRNVGDGYVCDENDNTVTILTVVSTLVRVTLPPAADRGFPLVLINVGDGDATIQVDGVDTVNQQSGSFVIPPGVTPLFSGTKLNSDSVSDWTPESAWVWA